MNAKEISPPEMNSGRHEFQTDLNFSWESLRLQTANYKCSKLKQSLKSVVIATYRFDFVISVDHACSGCGGLAHWSADSSKKQKVAWW